MKRTIGVLITYYNEKELLTEFLESLLKQTCQVDEILIYDDASTAAAEQYLPLRCPAKVIRGSINRGPSYGRNILLQESQSDYIHFQDADDLFHPDWCLRVSQAIEATQAEWILTEISSYQNGELACERVLELNKRTGVTDWVRQAIQGAILVPAGTYLRSKIQVIGGYRKDLWQSEDYDFHVRLAATDPSIAVIDEPLIHIRLRSNSRSKKQAEVWGSAVEAITKLADELPEKYRFDLAEAAARAGSMLFRNNAKSAARRAFALAKKLGPPEYERERKYYRFIARNFGQEQAERFGQLYRSCLPEMLRRQLRRSQQSAAVI